MRKISTVLYVDQESNQEVFSLVFCDVTLEYVLETAKKHNARILSYTSRGDSGGNPEYVFSTDTYREACELIEAFYGPEDESRDSNHFYIRGN